MYSMNHNVFFLTSDLLLHLSIIRDEEHCFVLFIRKLCNDRLTYKLDSLVDKTKQSPLLLSYDKQLGFYSERYSSDEMYTVVADIKNYRKFVPFCNESTILSENPGEVQANLVVGFPPVTENYTSKVTLVKPSLVQAVCHDGRLFNYLETTWKFSPGLKSNPKSCIIEFYINFEFKSQLHSRLAHFFFDSLVKQMEHAFISEAKRRYGTESIPEHTFTVFKR